MRAYEWKIGLSLTLLVMILMRLVWMDLRSYVIEFGPQSHNAFEQTENLNSCARSFELKLPKSLRDQGPDLFYRRPGWANAWAYHAMIDLSCKGGVFVLPAFIRYNQGILISTLLALMLLTRIMTHSWIVAMVAGVALLSRGRLIASLGQIGADHLISIGLVIWGLSFAHWLRSGSRLVLGLHYLAIFWLLPLEPGFCFLAFVLPILLWYCHRYGWENLARLRRSQEVTRPLLWWPWRDLIAAQSAEEKAPVQSGGILQPVPGGVGRLWKNPNFVRLSWQFAGIGAVLLLAELFILTLVRHDPIVPRSFAWSAADGWVWFMAWIAPIDRDLGLALIAMLLVLILRTPWLLGLRALIWATVLGFLWSSIGSLIGDLLFLPGESHKIFMASRLFLWWEPLILCLGMLAFYQLLLELIPRYLPRFLKSPKQVPEKVG